MFAGRKEELKLLSSLLDKKTSSLVVVYGRRRVGKSRLIEEFGSAYRFLHFAGLAPSLFMTNEKQLQEFCRRVSKQCKTPVVFYDDWSDAFEYFATLVASGRYIILFDEITWMAKYDGAFLSKFKNVWDMAFKKNSKLIMVLCGSVSSWIQKNILSNTGFHGRISLKLRLQELTIPECHIFWHKKRQTAQDILKILSVTGGIPKYLEEVKSNLSVDENIKDLCFSPSGILFNDYQQIFSNMLERDSVIYQKVIEALSSGAKSLSDLRRETGSSSGGTFSEYLQDLEVAGFIKKFPSWQLSTGKIRDIHQYQLSDNYLRFYLKYILPNIHPILSGNFQTQSLSLLPGWAGIMSLQFENLVLNNRRLIQEKLRIYPEEIICDNPYIQRATKRLKGCQIDYLIQTRLKVLYLCEVKFSRNTIDMSVINEVAEKIKRLSLPRGFSLQPVLIHAGVVHDDVMDAQYFYRIIDFAEFL